MDKKSLYNELVASRRSCTKCVGLENPSVVASGRFDSDQIGPWSLWQGNLDAEVLVVGQDWGDVNFFVKQEGIDPERNPTNQNLTMLLRELGIDVAPPGRPQVHVSFFTNAILCLKSGGLQAKLQSSWLTNCVSSYLVPLIEIVKPRVVVSLAQDVSKALYASRKGRPAKFTSYGQFVEAAPFECYGGAVLFPVYHCGAGGVNRNRPFPEQQKDWRRIASYLGQ